jgi:hypothetical protein
MRVIAITNVKNEIDIIEAFVRHTLDVTDRLIVLDNGSSDGTLAVLRALEAEGLPLDIVEDPSLGMYQGRRTTRLMREWAVERYRADWVLPLDADEFVVVPAGTSLVPVHPPQDRPIALPWRTYVPSSDDDTSEANPVLRIRNRLKQEACRWVKVLVPGRFAGRPDASLSQGNHDLLVGGAPLPLAESDGAFLAHFPVRSPGQYLAKIAMNTLQYLVIPDRRIEGGWHYREAYNLLRRDPQAFQDSFFEAARRYCCTPGSAVQPDTTLDPLPFRGGRLRHTRPVDDKVRGWLAVLACAESLARRQAALVASLDEQDRVAVDRLGDVFSSVHAHSAEQFHIALSWHSQLMQAGHQLLHLQQEAQQARQQAQLAQHQAEQALQQAAEQARLSEALRQSWTWRVGRLVLGPLRPIKALATAFRQAWRRHGASPPAADCGFVKASLRPGAPGRREPSVTAAP